MSNKLKKSLKPIPTEPKVWCLSMEDWNKFEACLIQAEEIFRTAEPVTPKEWQAWTSEFAPGEGFNSIIYHNKPVIIRPPNALMHKGIDN